MMTDEVAKRRRSHVRTVAAVIAILVAMVMCFMVAFFLMKPQTLGHNSPQLDLDMIDCWPFFGENCFTCRVSDRGHNVTYSYKYSSFMLCKGEVDGVWILSDVDFAWQRTPVVRVRREENQPNHEMRTPPMNKCKFINENCAKRNVNGCSRCRVRWLCERGRVIDQKYNQCPNQLHQ